MKIVATPIPAASPVTLGEDAAGDYIIEPPQPVERREVQSEGLAFADTKFVTGRGNREYSFSWVVARQHADQEAAEGFTWGHAATVPMNCSLAITDAPGAPNFSSAVIVEVAIVELKGQSTKTRYTVQGAVPAT
jgi:hypothetical protein